MQINGTIFNASLEQILGELQAQLNINQIPLLQVMRDSGNDIMVSCPYHILTKSTELLSENKETTGAKETHVEGKEVAEEPETHAKGREIKAEPGKPAKTERQS